VHGRRLWREITAEFEFDVAARRAWYEEFDPLPLQTCFALPDEPFCGYFDDHECGGARCAPTARSDDHRWPPVMVGH
jgi:hypothetical protein